MPRGAYQQDTFRHPPAEPAIVAGSLEKIDHFAKLILGFVDAGDIGKGDAGIGFDIDFGLALADLHQAAAETSAFRDATADVPPQAKEQQDRHDP